MKLDLTNSIPDSSFMREVEVDFSTSRNVIKHAIISGTLLLIALPVIYALVVSTQSPEQVYEISYFLPGNQLIENYSYVLFEFGMFSYIINSLLMSLIIVAGKVSISLLAALVLVYFSFPLRKTVFLLILGTLMLPISVRIVPLFITMVELNWVDSMWSLTVPYLASATAVFLFYQKFRSIPEQLVEIAKLRGIGPIRFLLYVLIPMSKGMIAGVCVIMFIFSWNQYLWPSIIIESESQQVVQTGLQIIKNTSQTGQFIRWDRLMSASMLALLPPLVLLIVARDQLIQTFGVDQ
jgi:sn-glycerol 3-phosphate transport system permease protein